MREPEGQQDATIPGKTGCLLAPHGTGSTRRMEGGGRAGEVHPMAVRVSVGIS